jgi:hypothetical protein
MYGKVSNPFPNLTFVERGDFFGNTRLWGRHILYNTHELYLGATSSGPNYINGYVNEIKTSLNSVFEDTPTVGSIENKSPTLYSIVNE